MPMQGRIGGAWRTPTACKAYVGGQYRSIKAIKAFVDGSWRDVANFTTGGGTITLTASASSVTRTGFNSSIQAGPVLVTPAGGQSPYTYAWTRESGALISATSANSAQTYFRASNMSELEERNAVFRCTCTDAFGSTATADVSVSITRNELIDTGGNV